MLADGASRRRPELVCNAAMRNGETDHGARLPLGYNLAPETIFMPVSGNNDKLPDP